MGDQIDGGGGSQLSYLRTVGPQTIICTQVVRMAKRTVTANTVTISPFLNTFRISDTVDYLCLKQRTVPGIDQEIDISDSFALTYDAPNKTTAGISQEINVKEDIDHYVKYMPRLNWLDQNLVVGDLCRFIYHETQYVSNDAMEYILIGDNIKKKLLSTNNDQTNNNWPVQATLEYIKCEDYINVALAAKEHAGVQDNLNVKEEIDFIHDPYFKSAVYHIDYDSFTKFVKLEPRKAQSLNFGEDLENKVIFIDRDNKMKKYPSNEEVTSSELETKSFYIEHGVLQQILMDFDKGDSNVFIKSIIDNADIEITKEAEIKNMQANKWTGIKAKASRGYSIKFFMRNFNKIKHMIFRFKTRLRG